MSSLSERTWPPTTSYVRDVNWAYDGVHSTPVNTGILEATEKKIDQ